MGDVMIREAQPGELAAVADLRVAAYAAGGFLNPEYAPELRALGTAGDGTVIVAVPDDTSAAGLIGTIMLVTWPQAGELVSGPMRPRSAPWPSRPASRRAARAPGCC